MARITVAVDMKKWALPLAVYFYPLRVTPGYPLAQAFSWVIHIGPVFFAVRPW